MSWYVDWFNTKYYHILYGNRDENEARAFIDVLLAYLAVQEGDKMLDVGCGKGRHSIYLSKKGADVVGYDISEANIMYAQQFESDTLSFFKHDMRRLFRTRYFGVVLNLFTSFGYFDTEKEHLDTLKNMKKALLPEGTLVIDFLNIEKIKKGLLAQEKKTVDGIDFHLKRSLNAGYLIKEIQFSDGDEAFSFSERVKAFTLSDFERMFSIVGLSLKAVFGDYALNPFEAETSPRLIMFASAKN